MSLQSSRSITVPIVVVLAISYAGASAFAHDTFKSASISIVRPDWDAVRSDAADLVGTAPADALTRLNEAGSKIFPGVAASAAPVLVPFDTRGYLRSLTADPAKSADEHLHGFQATGFFASGPAGYDAVFSIKPGAVPELGAIGRSEPVLVEISASTLLYDLPAPKSAADFPCAVNKRLLRTSAVSFSKTICATRSKNTA